MRVWDLQAIQTVSRAEDTKGYIPYIGHLKIWILIMLYIHFNVFINKSITRQHVVLRVYSVQHVGYDEIQVAPPAETVAPYERYNILC